MLSLCRLSSVGTALFVSFVMASVAGGVALQPGDIVVGAHIESAGSSSNALLEIDPATGDRTVISDDTTGSGPSLNYGGTGPNRDQISYISYEPDGSLLVTLENGVGGASALMRVDPATGDRTLINDSLVNSGPSIGGYTAARDFGSNILVSGNLGMAVVRSRDRQ